MYCSQCGYELSEGSRFCNMCGHSLEEPIADPPPVPNSPPSSAVNTPPSPAPQTSGTVQRIIAYVLPRRKTFIIWGVIIVLLLSTLTYCNSKNYKEDCLTKHAWYGSGYESGGSYSYGYQYYAEMYFRGNGTLDVTQYRVDRDNNSISYGSSEEGEWELLRNNVLYISYGNTEIYCDYGDDWSLMFGVLTIDNTAYSGTKPTALIEYENQRS